MRLMDAYNLLVEDGISDNHRYFSELYKQFSYRDESLLKDYLEFIFYDPVEWMRGFPKKLTTKTSFSKPKTAIIKLLKKPAVVEAVGADFAERLHAKVWKMFKENSETLLAERARTVSAPTMTVVGQFEPSAVMVESLDSSDAESLHSYEELPIPDRTVGVRRNETCDMTSQIASPNSVIASVEEEREREQKQEERHRHADADRIRLLKDVLRSMAKTLPDGVSDAFVALVEYV